jgi:hypothetical protein
MWLARLLPIKITIKPLKQNKMLMAGTLDNPLAILALNIKIARIPASCLALAGWQGFNGF